MLMREFDTLVGILVAVGLWLGVTVGFNPLVGAGVMVLVRVGEGFAAPV